MNDNFAIQLFEGKKVRIVWDEEQEKYYFSVTDIVQVLTDQPTPRGASTYWAVLKKRLKEEGADELITNCKQLKLPAADGKNYRTDVADLEQIFRIIQSVPSKKAEPVKRWLAELGSMRVDQMIDPELTFQMAVEDYRRQGYSDRWINERMRSIEMSGMTTGEYKRFKGLTKQNLRDNMTNVELALNTLAEVATTEYSRQSNPQTMAENRRIAQEGGSVARDARETMERRLGRSVVSPEKASDYIKPIEGQGSDTMPLLSNEEQEA